MKSFYSIKSMEDLHQRKPDILRYRNEDITQCYTQSNKTSTELFLSLDESCLCFFLEQGISQIQCITTFPGLSKWKVKPLKDVLRACKARGQKQI